MINKLVLFWSRHVSPRIATLIAAMSLVGLITCLLLLIFLGWLCHEILEQESFAMDTQVLLGLHQWANPVLDQIMLSLTKLGNPAWVVVLVISSLGWLLGRRQWIEARTLAIACFGALILNWGLKLVFVRPRPELWNRLINETSYSFPSGHALGSLVLYGFLAHLLTLHYPKYSGWIYAAAAGLIAAIGLSRLYLGVHYPTDILAGYAIGFLWLSICVVMLKLQMRTNSTMPTAHFHE